MQSTEQSGIRAAASELKEADRIGWLVLGLGSTAYGKERRAVTTFKHTRRIRPHFLTTVWEDGSVRELLAANGFEFTPVTIGYLGRARLRWTLINLWHMPKLLWQVVQIYRAQDCRGVVVLALLPFANVLPALLILKLLCGARVVFYLGDIPANTAPHRALAGVMERMADAIIVNSNAVRRGLQTIGVRPDRVRVVYNGLALDRFHNPSPFPWREQFGWDTQAVVIGYAGQFARNKGVTDFVRAAEGVLGQTDRCRFVLVGRIDDANASYRELVEQIAEENLEEKIRFAGWTSETERAYAAMQLMVVPSRHEEAASNVIIEAMASGLPVIATRTGGSPELLRDGVTGFMVEKERPEEIAEKILLLANDPSLLSKMGSAAREHARTGFDARQNARLFEHAALGERA